MTLGSPSGAVTGGSTYSIPITCNPAPTNLSQFSVNSTGDITAAEITELVEYEGQYSLKIETIPTTAGSVTTFYIIYSPEGYEPAETEQFTLTILGVQNPVVDTDQLMLNISDPQYDEGVITVTENGEAYTGTVQAHAVSLDPTASAVVNDNVITFTAIKEGTTTFYISCQKMNYRTVDIMVNVIVSEAYVSLYIDSPTPPDPYSSTVWLSVNDTEQITYTVDPSDADIAYRSDDTSVATVSDTGLITAIGSGTCNVEVIATKENYKATSQFINIGVY